MTGPDEDEVVDLTMSDDGADDASNLASAAAAAAEEEEEEADDDDICSLDTLPAPAGAKTEFDDEDYDRETEPDLGRRSSSMLDDGCSFSAPPTPRPGDAAREADVGEGVSGDLPPPSFQFDKGTVRVHAIPGDGHCLFRACLHQRRRRAVPRSRRRRSLPSDAEVRALRTQIAEYMRDHREELSHFFVEDGPGQRLDESIQAVEGGDWGDATCLNVVANLWKVPVEVYMEMGTVLRHFPCGESAIGMSPKGRAARPVRLAYRCVEEGGVYVHNHYDSVDSVLWDDPQSSQATALWPITTVTSDASLDASSSRPPSASPARPPSSAAAKSSTAASPPRTSPPATPVRRCHSPVRSPRVAKRLCAEEPANVSASLPSSQELLEDRRSPTPGLMAPGSPDAQCLSASQGAATEKLSQDTVVSCEPPPDPHPPPADGADGDSGHSGRSAAQMGSPLSRTTHTSMDRLLTQEPFSPPDFGLAVLESSKDESSTRTRQWVDEVVPVTEEEMFLDEGEFVFHVEPAMVAGELDEVTQTRDVATQISTVGNTCLYEWTCYPFRTFSQKIMTPNGTKPKLRTVSSNVRIANGHLIGTFQVIYSKL